MLTSEFQDNDSEKLINKLGVFDDLYILFLTQNFHDLQLLTYNIHSDIFLLGNEKMEVE